MSACAHNAAATDSGATESNGSDSGGSSQGSDSGGSSQGSDSGGSDSGQSDSNSSDSSQGSSDASSGSSDASVGSSQDSADSSQNSSGSSGDSSRGSQGSGDQVEPSAVGEVSAVVMGSALVLSTVAGIGFAIYGTVAAVRHQRHRPDARSAALYLGAQAHQLEQDLALGAGPVLDDLGAAAGLPPEQRGHFGQLLRRHRVELLELARREALTPERALSFLERVGELTWADPILRAEATRSMRWLEVEAG